MSNQTLAARIQAHAELIKGNCDRSAANKRNDLLALKSVNEERLEFLLGAFTRTHTECMVLALEEKGVVEGFTSPLHNTFKQNDQLEALIVEALEHNDIEAIKAQLSLELGLTVVESVLERQIHQPKQPLWFSIKRFLKPSLAFSFGF